MIEKNRTGRRFLIYQLMDFFSWQFGSDKWIFFWNAKICIKILIPITYVLTVK